MVFSLAFPVASCENAQNFQIPEANANELSVRLERSECYGTCPIYALAIESDGKVTFDGKGYTKVIGKAQSRIDQDQINQIIGAIKSSDFFSFDNKYDQDSGNCPGTAADMPTVTLSIRLGDQEKKIIHYLGCWEPMDRTNRRNLSDAIFPQKLYLLENKIDEIVESNQWIGMK